MSKSWEELKLASELKEAIDAAGWTRPTQVQAASVPPMLKGQDVALQSRTGSGKTGAFVLPLLQRAIAWQHTFSTNTTSAKSAAASKKQHRRTNSNDANSIATLVESSSSSAALPPVFLILVPSVELCAQTVTVFEKLGRFIRPRVQLINLPARQQQAQPGHHRGVTPQQQIASMAPIDAPISSALALVSTPAFLVKAIKSGVLPIDLVGQISVLVVDEADMLTSHASMQFLYGLLPPTRQSIILSATLTESVARLKGALLNQPIAVRVDEEENLNNKKKAAANENDDDAQQQQSSSSDKNANDDRDGNEVRVVLPAEDRSKLKQHYLVATDDCNRHTLLYSLFRFQNLLLPGKTLIFVDDDKEPYRLQHFLEQLAVHALVYDMTLPVKARCDILNRFQSAEKGVLICTDLTLHMAERLQAELGKQTEREQGEIEEIENNNKEESESDDSSDSSDDDEDEAVNEDDGASKDKKKQKKQREKAAAAATAAAAAAEKKKKEQEKAQAQQQKTKQQQKGNKTNVEPGLSRGIDFQNVTNVVLFQGVKAVSDEAFTNYLHRVGRTARAGQEGQAIALFSVPEAKQMLGPLRDFLRESRGEHLRPFKKLDRSHASALQYRVQAAIQNVTRHAAKKLRVANVAAEMGRSAYLSTRLNEADAGVLKRLMNGVTRNISGDRNLRNVPSYMKIDEADDTKDFESRVNARKLAGGSSRAQMFRNLTKKPRTQDPLAEVAAKMAMKRRKVEGTD